MRSGGFLDDEPDPAEVPGELIELVTEEATWQRLCDEWDEMYPSNPVAEDENEE